MPEDKGKDQDQDQEQDHDSHQKLTDQIADGKAIDWKSYESITDVDRLNKIKAVEQISQAFTQTIVTETTTTTKNATKALFEWGHLKVIEKIGEGSFGQVYKAYDPILNREVALKLRHADMTSASGSRAFLQEARRLARVRHPNVIAVHGAAFEDDQVGIWTDLIDGHNLKEYFIENGVLELNTAYDLIRDMAQALNAVHQANLIHGDIKSSNVMRQKNGVFKLMDFGAGSESINSSLPPSMGTPLLMAPELFKGETISPASDQYSLGVMLYQILTGQYPLTATSTLEIKQLHEKSKIIPIQKLRPDLPRQLCELINSLLTSQPQNRPTAAHVVDQINWIKNAPKRRKKIWAVAAVITSLSVGIIISSWGYLNAVKSEKKAQLAKQESVAVSDFLADIIKSARPGVSGKNTPIIEVLEMADKRLETSLLDQPLARAEVLHHIGNSYYLIADYDAAYKTLKQAHQIRLKQLGKYHIDTLATQQSLGRSLSLLSRFDEAKELLFLEDVIINTLPLDNNQRLKFKYAQSVYHSLQGENEQSNTIVKEILSAANKKQDPDYYFEMLLNYGTNLLNLKKFNEAEVVLNEVHIWTKNNPSKNAMLLKVNSNFASLYGQTQRFEQAEQYVRLNIQQASDWLGVEDPFVIGSMSLLSNILNAQGKIEESEQVNLKALNLSKNVFGENYWLSLRLMTNQANRLGALNRLDEAIAQNLETIEIAEKTFPSHNYSYIPWKNLSTLYYQTGQFKQASDFAQKAIPFLIEHRGAEHLMTLEARYLYGASLFYLGQTSVGLDALKMLLPIAEKNLGEAHALVTDIKAVLAESEEIK